LVTLGLLLIQGLPSVSAKGFAPADSAIKAAMADRDRFEPEIASLTPNRTANIRRLETGLALTEQRWNLPTTKGIPADKRPRSV